MATALIIDSSGSMGSEDPQDLRKDASKAYLTVSKESDEVGVVDFDDDAVLLSDPVAVGPNRTALEQAIDQIDSSGGTDLGAGLDEGCASLDRATAAKRGAIFLTDGDGSYNDEAACFAARGWPVYTIGLGDGVDDALLQEIATETNGRYLPLNDATNIICEFQQIRAELSGVTGSGCGNTGTVAHGQTTSQTLQIGSNIGQATVTMSYAGASPAPMPAAPRSGPARRLAAADGTDLRMTLVAPDGTEYTRDTVSPDFIVSFGATFESFSVTNPAPGTWTVRVAGLNVPSGTATFNLSSVQLPASNNPQPPQPPQQPNQPNQPVLTNTAPPTLSGGATWGKVLTAAPGSWSSPDAEFRYQWFRDGQPIPGATGPTYTIGIDDIGHDLTVTVTAIRANFRNGQATSAPVRAAKVQPSMGASPVRKRVKRGKRPAIEVVVRFADFAPTGLVRFEKNGRRIGQTTLAGAVNGTITGRTRKLRPGTHVIDVEYLGDRRTAPASDQVKVKVVKPKRRR